MFVPTATAGAEIDPNSAHLARGTISRNFSSNRITLVETRATDRLFALLGEHAIDWTMCNPPFYNSQEEIDQLAANKAIGPHAVSLPPVFLARGASCSGTAGSG
jgi:23S rRNA A1618 N6-methylase RlmF